MNKKKSEAVNEGRISLEEEERKKGGEFIFRFKEKRRGRKWIFDVRSKILGSDLLFYFWKNLKDIFLLKIPFPFPCEG